MIRCRVFLALVVVVACNRSESAPKRPLSGEVTALPAGHPDIASSAQSGEPRAVRPMIGGAAKVALDSGNVLYTARMYPAALEQYRRSAALAPEEEAPLIGIMMVANVTSNTKLADSVTASLRKLNGPLAGRDSLSAAELKDIHAGIRPAAPRLPTGKKL